MPSTLDIVMRGLQQKGPLEGGPGAVSCAPRGADYVSWMEETIWQEYCSLRDERLREQIGEAKVAASARAERSDARIGWVIRILNVAVIVVLLALLTRLPAPSAPPAQGRHEAGAPASAAPPHPRPSPATSPRTWDL